MRLVSNGTEDTLWESTNGIKLLKQLWKCGNATGQTNTNYVSWKFRYKAPPDSFVWSVYGALGANVDIVDTVLDSIHQSRTNTASANYVPWTIPPQFAVRMMADTLDNHGWVWQNYSNNQVGQVNDAEIIYYSSNDLNIMNRPLISVKLLDNGGIACRQRGGSLIGSGLIGD